MDPLALVPRILCFGLLSWAFYYRDERLCIVYGFFLYLVMAYGLRFIFIPSVSFNTRKFLGEQNYVKAIESIEQELDYFERKKWLDKYRIWLMISWSNMTFREALLCSKAYCLLQSRKVSAARSLYADILEAYPQNAVAMASLNTIEIITQSVREEMLADM